MDIVDTADRFPSSSVKDDTCPSFLTCVEGQEGWPGLIIYLNLFTHGSWAITASQLAISSATLRISSSNSTFWAVIRVRRS